MDNPTNSIQAALRRPFPSNRIEWRVAMSGEKDNGPWARVLAYIDNRAAMERLDDVFGANWSQEERFAQVGSAAVATVTIHISGIAGYPDRTVTGSCAVEASGDIDQFKSAASGAMKRAVVNLGIGRYLYDLPEAWAEISDKGVYSAKTKSGKWFKWNPPALPAWAIPSGDSGNDVSATSTAEAQDEQPGIQPMFSQPTAPSKVAPAKPNDGYDPWNTTIHFGKNKDKALRDLPENTLKWYVQEWQPKPFKGKISQQDTNLRLALDIISGNGGVGVVDEPKASHTDDDDNVPF